MGAMVCRDPVVLDDGTAPADLSCQQRYRRHDLQMHMQVLATGLSSCTAGCGLLPSAPKERRKDANRN